MRIATLIPSGETLPTRDKVRAQLADLPPIDASDIETAKTYADLVPDNYAAAALEIVDSTGYGGRARVMRYAVGGLIGLLVGGLAVHFIGGK